MIQPSIHIFGIRVDEPVTTATDLLVAAVCYFAFYKLHKAGRKERSVFYFKYFFLTMGLSTTMGGLIGHGFLYYFGFAWKIPGWVTGMCSIAFMERAAIMQARNIIRPSFGKLFAYLNIIELVIFICIALSTLNFSWVELHATYGLIVVFLFESFIYNKKGDPGSKFILYAVGASAMAALTHVSKFTLHTWFNYFDLSHMFMALSCWLLYQGAVHMNLKHVEGMERLTEGNSTS